MSASVCECEYVRTYVRTSKRACMCVCVCACVCVRARMCVRSRARVHELQSITGGGNLKKHVIFHQEVPSIFVQKY